jgi:hypothetical protein
MYHDELMALEVEPGFRFYDSVPAHFTEANLCTSALYAMQNESLVISNLT